MSRPWPRRASAAVVLAAILGSAGAAAELPRVFLSPRERAALTASRLSGRPLSSPAASAAATAGPTAVASAGESPQPGPATALAPSAPPPQRIDGITFGAGANQAVWIGGQRIADGGTWAGQRVRVMQDGVQLTARDGRVRLLRVGMAVPP